MQKMMMIVFSLLSIELYAEELKMSCETIGLYGKMIMSFKQEDVSKAELQRLMSNTINLGPREILENENNLNYTRQLIPVMIEEAFKQPVLKSKQQMKDQVEDFSFQYEHECIENFSIGTH